MDGINWQGLGIRPDRAGDRSVGLRCQQKDRHAKRLNQKTRLNGTCQDGCKISGEVSRQTRAQASCKASRTCRTHAEGGVWKQRPAAREQGQDLFEARIYRHAHAARARPCRAGGRGDRG